MSELTNREVALVSLLAGVGVGYILNSQLNKAIPAQEPTPVKKFRPSILKRNQSLTRIDDTAEQLKIMEWENLQLRKELVLTKATNNTLTDFHDLDANLLSHGDCERLEMMFLQFDKTNSGYISLDDLPALCLKLGFSLNDEEWKEELARIDANNSSKIKFHDFLFWWTEMQSHKEFKLESGNLAMFDPTRLRLNETGNRVTPEYRMFFEYEQDNGKLKAISPWHDIPLYSSEGICNFICEIPKWTRAKYEIAVNELHNPIKQDTKNGKLRYYKHGDMMFNYGAFPQTWEDPDHIPEDTGCVGDNDPIDVIEIGMKQLGTGSVTPVKPLGIIALLDDGETDWKVIVINIDDPLASKLKDIHDVEKHVPGAIEAIREYLRTYKVCVGKPENKFGLGERCMPLNYAWSVIKETHEQWKKLHDSGATTSSYRGGHDN